MISLSRVDTIGKKIHLSTLNSRSYEPKKDQYGNRSRNILYIQDSFDMNRHLVSSACAHIFEKML